MPPPVVLVPHAAPAFTGPCLDGVRRALADAAPWPPGAALVFVPNNHHGRADWEGRAFAQADFEAVADPGRTEHSYWWHRDAVRGLVGAPPSAPVVVAFPAWHGELPPLPAAVGACVVSADLWHSHDADPADDTVQRVAAWASDGALLDWLTGRLPVEPPEPRGGAGVPTCARANLRAFRRLAAGGAVVVDAYASSGEVGAPWRACWPPPPVGATPYFVTYAGVVATPATPALREGARGAARRLVHAAAHHRVTRGPAATAGARLPRWALGQLGLDGRCGVYVTAHRPDGGVWCCYGAVPGPDDDDGPAGFDGLLDLAVRRCTTLDPRREGPPPVAPAACSVTLLAPVATWQPAPPGDGPDRASALRAGWSVGWGTATPDGRWDGAVFLPSVWRENPAWAWGDLVAALRRKAGGGARGRAWLIRSDEIRPAQATPHEHAAPHPTTRAGRGRAPRPAGRHRGAPAAHRPRRPVRRATGRQPAPGPRAGRRTPAAAARRRRR